MIDEEYPGRVLLAEACQLPQEVREYFGNGDEFHMGFHFPVMPRIFMAIRSENVLKLRDILASTPSIPANCQWVTFLRNHDELTLEMVVIHFNYNPHRLLSMSASGCGSSTLLTLE